MTDETAQPDTPPADSNDVREAPAAGQEPAAVPEGGPADAAGAAAAAADAGAGAAAPEAADEAAELRRERDELRDRWLRAVAELDNFRKRTRKELEDARVYAVAGLLRDLLEVLDNFERATISMREMGGGEGELENLKNGVQLIHQRFRDLLLAQGLERIDAAGAEFDPSLHEAILQVEQEGVPSGRITEVVQPGYKLKDLVIRPCRVIVAR
jgi:molecular chaperone GrpE